MLLPSILAVKEVPSALRSVGLIPLIFLLPAQGLWKVSRWLAKLVQMRAKHGHEVAVLQSSRPMKSGSRTPFIR